jgi:hypothetical protein
LEFAFWREEERLRILPLKSIDWWFDWCVSLSLICTLGLL